MKSGANHGICQEFCIENGLECVKVEEDKEDSCTRIDRLESGAMDCYTDAKKRGAGSDYLCTCG